MNSFTAVFQQNGYPVDQELEINKVYHIAARIIQEKFEYMKKYVENPNTDDSDIYLTNQVQPAAKAFAVSSPAFFSSPATFVSIFS